jgi:hypothetical protein
MFRGEPVGAGMLLFVLLSLLPGSGLSSAGALVETGPRDRQKAEKLERLEVLGYRAFVIPVVYPSVASHTAGGGASRPSHPEPAPDPGLEPFQGLGTWVDIFDPAAWNNPEGTVARIASLGARTLYLQTTNYRHQGPFRFPTKIGRFVDAAAEAGLNTVAWYLSDFVHMKRDRNWSLAAINFRTSAGNGFDGFGLDIEAEEVRSDQARANRVVRLSRQIRNAAGNAYPLGAITPPPIRDPGYWPIFPDAELADIYDVVLPMAYWAFHERGPGDTRGYIEKSIEIVRARSGNPQVPIHLIGGVADDINRAEARAFVRAAREYGLLGASLYDEDTSGPEDWAELIDIEPTPIQQPVMPLTLGSHLGAYGNIPGGDTTHPREVFFRTGRRGASGTLRFEAHDMEQGEVTLRVNWVIVARIVASSSWQEVAVAVPARYLRSDGRNLIHFELVGGDGEWGVREVRLNTS